MLDLTTPNSRLQRCRRALRRMVDDRRGVAAIEFAFIAPVLLALYFVTMEVGQAIETNKKVGRIGSMVADLITQQQSMPRSELEAIMRIGGAIIQPYNRTQPNIVVTAIQVTNDETPDVEVVWSRKMVDGSFSRDAQPGSTTTIPDRLIIPGTFLIRVEGGLDYQPVITWAADGKAAMGLTSAFDNIEMSETYYLRPRMSPTIDCMGC
jgi:Flp pilus assembly protein TadG